MLNGAAEALYHLLYPLSANKLVWLDSKHLFRVGIEQLDQILIFISIM